MRVSRRQLKRLIEQEEKLTEPEIDAAKKLIDDSGLNVLSAIAFEEAAQKVQDALLLPL